MHLYIVRCNSPKGIAIASSTLGNNVVSFVEDQVHWHASDIFENIRATLQENRNVILHTLCESRSNIEQYIQIARDAGATYSIIDVHDDEATPLAPIPMGYRYTIFRIENNRLVGSTV